MHLGEGRHFHGIVDDEGRLDKGAFAELAENFVDEFTFTHSFISLNSAFGCHFSDLVFAHAIEVESCLFLDGIQDGNSLEWSLETNSLPVYFN